MKFKKEFGEMKDLIDKANTIAVFSHRNPDPDSIGANMALSIMLNNKGKDVYSVCIDEINPKYSFIPFSNNIHQELKPKNIDLFISVDCGSYKQIVFEQTFPEILNGEKPFINIDHHVSNELFGTVNIVDTKAAATVEIMYHIFKYLNINITPPIATCLLAGFYYDTGSFKHMNTNSENLDIAAELISKGANLPLIIQNMYKSSNISQLKLLGNALMNCYMDDENIVRAGLNSEDFISTGATPKETSGIVDYLNMVPNQKYTFFASEDLKGNVKGSLRTQLTNVDVSLEAKKLGGGGHKMASGFSVKGKIKKQKRISIKKEE